MAGNDGPKVDIPLRAAKGVSRFFLFEALRTGGDEIGTTSAQLGSARDRAEKTLTEESPVEFESLIQDILESCAKSLQTHAAIVEAVAETLRGDVDESDENSKENLNKFALLVGQIKDAAAGVRQLGHVNVDKEDSPPLPTESDFDSEPEVLSSKKSRKHEESILPSKKKTKTKHASNTSAPVIETPSSDATDEKTMKGKGKKLSKFFKHSGSTKAPEKVEDTIKIKAAKESSQPLEPSSEVRAKTRSEKADTALPPSTPRSVPAQQTFVDEDDINAEVEARLRAKEAKRAKKKEAKKRKRDSVASDIFSPEPKAEPAHEAFLPAKKRARIDKIDDDVKGKRQSIDDAPGSKVKTKKQKIDNAAEKEEKTVEANKAKRRRSSNVAVEEVSAAPQTNNRNKKRKVGF
ncbi:hypothetical protein E4T50_12680 [Aureobasidium sp. EXF-12298]|nr:hypothetical protein E4T50_12680 [Aureobasidium sp. EXF-12298]